MSTWGLTGRWDGASCTRCSGTNQQGTTHPLVIIMRNGGNRSPKGRYASCDKISGDPFETGLILLWVLEMSEMKTQDAIDLELQEAWSNDCSIEIDSLTGRALDLGDDAAFGRAYCEVALHELAVDALPTIHEPFWPVHPSAAWPRLAVMLLQLDRLVDNVL